MLKSDRPLRRQIIKLACQAFLGKSRAHYQAWLPGLSIEGRGVGSPGTVKFRRQPVLHLLDADSLAVRAGARIVVVGSGPSVKAADLTALPPRSALLLNGAISLIGQTIAEPLAVAVEDERFVHRHFAMMRDRMPAGVLCLFSVAVVRAILETDPSWLSGRSIILIDDIRKPYAAPRRARGDIVGHGFALFGEDDAGFSADPDRGVFQGGSVAISALQFALHTGADEIGFIGVDIVNADSPRFYEKAGDVAFSGIVGAEKRILAHIAVAKAFAEGKGTALVNHSPVSALKSIGLGYRPLSQTDA